MERSANQAEAPPACPTCGAAAAAPVGAPFVGTIRRLWRRRSFEERLYRCAERHVYSVRSERSRGTEQVTTAAHESVEDWLRTRVGAEPSIRPPGL
jgi:hypothetical protein